MTAHCGLGSLVLISYLQMVVTIFYCAFVICMFGEARIQILWLLLNQLICSTDFFLRHL